MYEDIVAGIPRLTVSEFQWKLIMDVSSMLNYIPCIHKWTKQFETNVKWNSLQFCLIQE